MSPVNTSQTPETVTPPVEPVRNPPMTKEQAEDFFGHVFLGKHHIPSDVKPFGRGWKVNAHGGSLATFDFDGLTRLVLLAHHYCVRVEITQGGPGRVGLCIWQRHGREGSTYSRHPTIETALENFRKYYPASEAIR